MKRISTFCTMLLLVASISIPVAARASRYSVPPHTIGMAATLFSDVDGATDLSYLSDLNLPELGVQITHFDFTSSGRVLGRVSRINSTLGLASAGALDVLVRFDEAGKIVGVVNLKPWKDGEGKEIDLAPLIAFLNGKNVSSVSRTIPALVAGLAASTSARGVDTQTLNPPKDFSYDVTDKILQADSRIPPLKLKTFSGKLFDTQGAGKSMVIFTAPQCAPCRRFSAAVETGLKLLDLKNQVRTLHVVAADQAEAREYFRTLGAAGEGISEPGDEISAKLQAPFKPYALLIDSGVVKLNVFWTDEPELFGMLYYFINNGPPNEEEIEGLEKLFENYRTDGGAAK